MEHITLSEIKSEDKYCMLSFTCRVLKKKETSEYNKETDSYIERTMVTSR